ncbi:ROK family transcriptional regulator [Peribacillus kribbensis]|uniref:ROK family transcriptional regulator n=1 Tax=Peribacillus kribbensis TaxID=356658 RepID=UPI0004197C5B|nr:ROK family transcriptional regulator [Peribacillus kribbensis]
MTLSQNKSTEAVSAQDMKITNKKTILKTLSLNGPLSRTKLASQLNLSKTTVSTLVSELLKEKLVLETGSISSSGAGRNAVEITFNAFFGYVLAIDIGRYWVRFSISNLNGEILNKLSRNISTSKTLENLMGHILSGTTELMAKLNIQQKQILSVCVSAPGIIDQQGILKRTLALPQLEGIHFRDHLDKLFPETSIRIENDINVAAVAENWKGIGSKYKTFVFLGIGSGLGCGFIINGQLFRGVTGSAGEIGFLRPGFTDDVPIEYELSSDGIVQAAKRFIPYGENLFHDVKSVFEVVSENINENRLFINWLLKRVLYLIEIFNCVINPEAIILGGGIGSNLSFLMPVLKSHISQLIDPPTIEISKFGDDIQLNGATKIALSRVSEELLELASKFA